MDGGILDQTIKVGWQGRRRRRRRRGRGRRRRRKEEEGNISFLICLLPSSSLPFPPSSLNSRINIYYP
jgi:hypothetical protein